MRYCNISLISLLCLIFGGCKSIQPNPQVSETLSPEPIYINSYKQDYKPQSKPKVTKKEKKQAKIIEPETSVKFFDGLYDPNEISAQIFFAFDSVTLSERDKNLLREEVIPTMQGKKSRILLVVGHSDWRGAPAYNENLGERRAKSVAHFLNSLGIARERIETFSLGSRYATPNLSKADGIKDRRCDIVFLDD